MMASLGESHSLEPTDIPYDQACILLVRIFQLDQLDLANVHPLVVSASLGPNDMAVVRRERFRGRTERDWYFVASARRDSTGKAQITPFHLINHGALHFLNRGRTDEWSLPLALCQPYADIIGRSAFSVYRDRLQVQEDKDTPVIFEEAFDTRLYLYKWLWASPLFRQRHPLTARQLQFAGVGLGNKRIDNIVYSFLASALKMVPNARARWMRGESDLLFFKLLMRPQLHLDILRIAGKASGTWEDAARSIEQVHERHAARAGDLSTNSSSSRSGVRLMNLAVAYLRELLRWDTLNREDAQMQHPLEPRTTTEAYSSRSLASIRRCAPQCMKNALASATGSTPQQASLSGLHRVHLAIFLIKSGLSVEDATRSMRPRVLIEYEMEEPQETWTGIQQRVKQAAGTLQRSKGVSASLQPDAHYAAQTCGTVMDAGMCPFRSAPPPNQHLLTKEQRKESAKKSYVSAKGKCHAQLRLAILAPPVTKRRKLSASASASVVSAVPREWASGPFQFAQQMQGGCGEGSGCSSSSRW